MEFGANGNTTNIYEYGAQRNSATINGTKGYYLYDGRGSVAGLTGNTGGSMITYRYDAYGNTTRSNNTLNNPYQYNAEYTDSSTGLQYLRARYYDSSQGRFTAKDTLLGSIEKPITRNLYTYCGNNPLNYVDPSGHLIIPGSKTANHMPIITPISQQQINREVRTIITDPFSPGMTILNPTERKAYYDKRIENIYGNYAYGPSYSNPTGPYRYDPVKNPFGQGKNGTQFTSKTTWSKGKTERIDVENPSPGNCPGQIHYHDTNNKKYTYNIADGKFYDYDTGELASNRIQKLLDDKSFMSGINKAKKYLGE